MHTVISLPHFPDARLIAVSPLSHSGTPRRAVIVCPGGAYHGLAAHEGVPVAEKFDATGIAAFVLHYTTKEKAANAAPLCQLALSICHIRENGAKYGIDPNYIFTCGFSAGGHLAGSAGVLYGCPEIKNLTAQLPPDAARPTGMILCYPVITSEEPYCNKGSFKRLCGTVEFEKEKADRFSLEKHVNGNTPPAFLWHTVADNGVPVENSLLFATALRRFDIPFEMHLFPTGTHGLGLCDGAHGEPNPHNACWIDLAIRWVLDL